MLDKSSEFAERAVHEWTAQVFREADGPILSAQYRLMIRTERTKARERKKYDAVELAPLHRRGDRRHRRPVRRGEAPAAPRPGTGRTSQVGDPVGPMVKGPLTVTDMVCWHVGMGMGLYGVKPLRLGYQNRTRIPRFFHRDDLNVPDVMQRVHWDPEFARRSGNPTTFDYGRMRETWLIHLCTDWMGDDAWLWKLDCEFRRFNYVGDTQWLSGTVTNHYLAEGGRPAVDVELQADEPAGRAHHAGPRHHPAAEPGARVRCGCPTLPAAPATCRRRCTAISEQVHGPDERRRGRRAPTARSRGSRIEQVGPVLELEIDRPKKRNALDRPDRRRR